MSEAPSSPFSPSALQAQPTHGQWAQSLYISGAAFCCLPRDLQRGQQQMPRVGVLGNQGDSVHRTPKQSIRRGRVKAPTLPRGAAPSSAFLLLLQRWGGRKRGGQRGRAVQSLKISRIEASTSGRCWGPHRGHLPRGTLQLCPEPPSPTQCPRPIAHCVNLSAHTTRRWRRLLPSRQRAAEEPGWLLCLICISELLWGGGGGNLDETKAVPSIAALLCSV